MPDECDLILLGCKKREGDSEEELSQVLFSRKRRAEAAFDARSTSDLRSQVLQALQHHPGLLVEAAILLKLPLLASNEDPGVVAGPPRILERHVCSLSSDSARRKSVGSGMGEKWSLALNCGHDGQVSAACPLPGCVARR